MPRRSTDKKISLFVDRLEEAIREAGNSQTKFAEQCGLTLSTINGLLNQPRVPKDATLAALARGAKRSKAWFLGEEEPAGRLTLPVLAVASASNGTVQALAEDDAAYVRSFRLPPNVHIVDVVGDSMIPVACHGQSLFVVPEPPGDGDLAVIETDDGEVLYKRVALAGKAVHCHSVNPDPRYRTIVLKRRTIRRMYRVVGAWFLPKEG